MNPEKFSQYQCFCTLLITCLKPFTVVIETLLHMNVGERYAGLSAFVAVLLLCIDAEVCPESQSTLMWLLMVVFAIRIVMLRVAGICRRRRGDYSVHSRSPGTSLLDSTSIRLPTALLPWIEPFAVMLMALIIAVLNPTVGDFLLGSGAALLGINLIRLSVAYNKKLDAADARVEQEAQSIEAGFTPSLAVSAPTPPSIIDVRAIRPARFPVAENDEAEIDPDLSGVLPLGGGALWKQ